MDIEFYEVTNVTLEPGICVEGVFTTCLRVFHKDRRGVNSIDSTLFDSFEEACVEYHRYEEMIRERVYGQ